MDKFRIEIVWNREWNFVSIGGYYSSIEAAQDYIEELDPEGDRIKKSRIIDIDTEEIVWKG